MIKRWALQKSLMFWHFWVLLQVKLSAEYSAGASGYTTNKLFEAAKIDGAGPLRMFFSIAVPLSWPVFLTSGLIVGLAVWNEFLFAITFIYDDSIKPMATILFSFSNRFRNDYSLISAAAIMMALPMAILFILFQKRFISGLTSGGLKQ